MSLLVVSSCKKKEYNPSTVVTASFPKITFTTKYYSIGVGTVRPVVQATAYDSFYKQSCKLITVDSAINTFVPGFYTGTVWAQNQYGYVTYGTYYVAVTNVSSSMDLSGHWIQSPTNDSISTNVVKLANGLYTSDNVNGVNIYTDAADIVKDYFVVTGNTTIAFASGNTGTLSYVALPGVSSMSYSTPTGSVVFSR